MKVNGIEYRTVWMEDNAIKTINQPLIPHSFEIVELKNVKETADAIKTMIIRGAPAIGAIGAYGVAQAALGFKGDDIVKFKEHVKFAGELLKSTRPTAYDLFYAVDKVISSISQLASVKHAQELAVKTSREYADNSADECKKIGEVGEKLIKDGFGVLTHCNAGALACVDYGTALAPMRVANEFGRKFNVFVDETRPRCQGSRLTAWELGQEGISHSIIADNAAGYYMLQGKVNLVITGADRIAANGDVANKIGTYEKAVLAKENGIPFYVAVPISTIDLNCKTGKDIKIEERDEYEVTCMFGWSKGKFTRIRIAPKESKAKNPAFDVTPAKYVTGIITPMGIVKPSEIQNHVHT